MGAGRLSATWEVMEVGMKIDIRQCDVKGCKCRFPAGSRHALTSDGEFNDLCKEALGTRAGGGSATWQA